jgi:hypothetical protein
MYRREQCRLSASHAHLYALAHKQQHSNIRLDIVKHATHPRNQNSDVYRSLFRKHKTKQQAGNNKPPVLPSQCILLASNTENVNI